MTARRTLRAEAVVEGVGLFTGAPCRASLRPAPAGEGVVLVCGGVRIPAHISCLSQAPAHPAFATLPARSTNLQAGPARALTVEYILSVPDNWNPISIINTLLNKDNAR